MKRGSLSRGQNKGFGSSFADTGLFCIGGGAVFVISGIHTVFLCSVVSYPVKATLCSDWSDMSSTAQ